MEDYALIILTKERKILSLYSQWAPENDCQFQLPSNIEYIIVAIINLKFGYKSDQLHILDGTGYVTSSIPFDNYKLGLHPIELLYWRKPHDVPVDMISSDVWRKDDRIFLDADDVYITFQANR